MNDPRASPFDALWRQLGDRYRPIREVGRGGMATVFLATDLRHGRDVAIKVIHPQISTALGADRFLREIRIAARLQHPNILPVLDSGEDGGLLWYSMPFVAGESLRARLAREKQLSVESAVAIVAGVAAGLSYAHRQNIIHRDIKPENILVNGDDPVIADFGIARAFGDSASDRLTETGLALGTAGYMSPEQATGERELDGRSDTYSLGCVLYEVLAGEPPFVGPTAQAVLARSLTETPRPLTRVRAELPEGLAAAVTRAMARTPADRFESAETFARAIKTAITTGARPSAPKRRAAGLGIVAAVAVVAAAGVYFATRPHPLPPPASIAVLRFENVGSDSADRYFAEGMADELLTALGELREVTVAARSASFSFPPNVDLTTAGARLGVDALLAGGVRRAGGLVRVTVHLDDIRTRKQLFNQVFERPAAEVFRVQEDIARAVIDGLRITLTGAGRQLIRDRTVNPVAHDLLLQARFALRLATPTGNQEGLRLVRQAIGIDSTYAAAWVTLSRLHFNTALFREGVGAQDSTRLAVERAVQLDSLSSEVQVALGRIRFRYDLDWPAAEAAFRRAIAINPSLAEAHVDYARFLRSMARFGESRAELMRATVLDPIGAGQPLALGRIAYFAHEFDEAIRLSNADPDHGSRTWATWTAEAYLAAGRYVEAAAVTSQARSDAPGQLLIRVILAARAGRPDSARRLLATMPAAWPYFRSLSFAALGQRDSAFVALDEAVRIRDPLVADLLVDPRMAPLRSDPRFEALLIRLRFPRPPAR